MIGIRSRFSPHPNLLPSGEGTASLTHGKSSAFDLIPALDQFLPLPLGEGRGEGKKMRRLVRTARNKTPLTALPLAEFICLNLLPINPSCFPQFLRRVIRSEEHTSELQSHVNLVCRLLLEKKK